MKTIAKIILGFIIFCVIVTITSCTTIEKRPDYIFNGESEKCQGGIVVVKDENGEFGEGYYAKHDENGNVINCSGWQNSKN